MVTPSPLSRGQPLPVTETPHPADLLGRRLHDLRISVTDRCNFRCVYCMPKEVFGAGFRFLPKDEILSFEEICRLARIFVGLGVEKVRITGGEPLLRRDLETLVRMLWKVEGIGDLTMTTNASLLPGRAGALREAGLRRVTVSLDALDDAVFRAMSDMDVPVRTVLDGIQDAEDAGLAPVKVNMVVKRGVNEDQILKLAEHFRGTGHVLRFIEFMDVGNSNGWRMDDVVSAREIRDRVDARWPLEPVEPKYRGEVREPVSLRRRGRRNRHHRVGDPSLLRGLQPGPPHRRRRGLHLPLRQPRAPASGHSSGTVDPIGRSPTTSSGCGRAGATGTRSSGARPPSSSRGSRCPGSAADSAFSEGRSTMHDILSTLEAWKAAGEDIALATVVRTVGSSPRAVGSKMAITASEKMVGSVSGGCVEGAVSEAALEVLETREPRLLTFGVADEEAWAVGLSCGGTIEVFVEPLDW